MTENMRIWDRVWQTDPRHTKQVSFGRKFTSIDAQYQIRNATEVFGPIGDGWGYEVYYNTEKVFLRDKGGAEQNAMVQFADVTIWWKDPGNKERFSFGPMRGCSPLVDEKGRLDDDAPKKATTDALTKLLSHLGFNADVFLGMFDDNKYVERLKRDIASKEREDAVKLQETVPADVKAMLERIRKIEKHDSLSADYLANKSEIDKKAPAIQSLILMTYKERRAQLGEAPGD